MFQIKKSPLWDKKTLGISLNTGIGTGTGAHAHAHMRYVDLGRMHKRQREREREQKNERWKRYGEERRGSKWKVPIGIEMERREIDSINKLMNNTYSMYVLIYFANIGFDILSKNVESDPSLSSDSFLFVSFDLKSNKNRQSIEVLCGQKIWYPLFWFNSYVILSQYSSPIESTLFSI